MARPTLVQIAHFIDSGKDKKMPEKKNIPQPVLAEKLKISLFIKALFGFLLAVPFAGQLFAAVSLTGENKVWHKITLTADGPVVSEAAATFRDYRMTVTFTKGTTSYTLSGFFAADGDAANSSATSGNKWRCHFRPDAIGTWTYTVHFLHGTDIAMKINSDNTGAIPEAPDGATGTIDIGPSDKTGKDFRNPERGLLRYVNKHHLKFSGSDRWFIRGGPGIPENLLAYNDFDGQIPANTYANHLAHYDSYPGATWKGTKGKAMIGLINYVAQQGANTLYAIMCNILGDGKDVWPFVGSGNFADAQVFDVSKLEQWDYIITHMNNAGIAPLLLFLEKENETKLDAGSLWKLYYREMTARFGHHLGVTWVLCEEMNQTPAVTVGEMTKWLSGVDGYSHPIGIHTPGNQGAWDSYYRPLSNLAGRYACMQTKADGFADIYPGTKTVRELSDGIGKSPWVVGVDEARTLSGTQGITTGPSHDMERKFALWGNLMAGGAGVSMYGTGDTQLQDFTPYMHFWNQCGVAINFMWDNAIPLGDMAPQDNLITNTSGGHCLAKAGAYYVIQLPNGGSATLDLTGQSNNFTVRWMNPKDGGALQTGSVTTITGGGKKDLGASPGAGSGDWIILVKSTDVTTGVKNSSTQAMKNELLLPSISRITSKAIYFSLPQAGPYRISLFTADGRPVLQSKPKHGFMGSQHFLFLPGEVFPGTYIIKLDFGKQGIVKPGVILE